MIPRPRSINWRGPRTILVSSLIALLLAPTGEHMVESEAMYAEALVAALVAHDRRATFLHKNSPMVRSAGIRLPSVSAGDDWTPLTDVLETIAGRLRLDYVILTALTPEDSGPAKVTGLLVARGGDHVRVSAGDAEAMAAEILDTLPDLDQPHDPEDQPVPIEAQDEPASEDEPEDTAEPAPITDDAPATEPPVEPVTVADEPELPEAPDSEQEGPGPDPAIAAVERAYENGNLDAARSLLADYVEERGPSSRTHFLRARLSLAAQQRDDAIDHLEQAVALEPGFVEARVWLARLLAERGLWQKAIEQYERALESDPLDLEALLGLARLYRDHGHRRQAISLLREADDAGQHDPSLLMLLGALQGHEDNVELAERYFLRAASQTSGERRAAALERLGDLYVGIDRHREALRCYLQAAELNPSRTSMVKRRYREVMTAADGAVHDALTSGWSAFQDFVENDIGEREVVYRTLTEVSAQLREALRFADSVKPPDDLKAEHARRQLAYSLAAEAAVSALSYLDIGNESMLKRATSGQGEALAEFQRLQQNTEG